MIKRFELTEAPESIPAFVARVSIGHLQDGSGFVVKAGSVVYGFGGASENATPYGYLVREDVPLAMPEALQPGESAAYVMLHRDGTFRAVPSDPASLRKPGAVDGLPWYTMAGNDDEALVGKCFFNYGFFRMVVACDSPRWCEFEGVF